MSKRYYYTCPIKALYMMKEFGVKYDFENEEGLIHIIKTPEIRRDNFMRKIYVAEESQKIFNSVSEIIYRDNKQFFMPEVEND